MAVPVEVLFTHSMCGGVNIYLPAVLQIHLSAGGVLWIVPEDKPDPDACG